MHCRARIRPKPLAQQQRQYHRVGALHGLSCCGSRVVAPQHEAWVKVHDIERWPLTLHPRLGMVQRCNLGCRIGRKLGFVRSRGKRDAVIGRHRLGRVSLPSARQLVHGNQGNEGAGDHDTTDRPTEVGCFQEADGTAHSWLDEMRIVLTERVIVSTGDRDIGHNDEGESVTWVECLDLWSCKNSSSFCMGSNGGPDPISLSKQLHQSPRPYMARGPCYQYQIFWRNHIVCDLGGIRPDNEGVRRRHIYNSNKTPPPPGRAKTIGYPFGDKAERPGVSFQRARLSGTACIAVARPANHGTQLSASGRQRDSRPVAWREISVDRMLTCAPQELVMMESRLQLLAEFDASSLVSSCRYRFSIRPQHIKRLGASLTDHRPLLGLACELNRLMPSPPMLVAPGKFGTMWLASHASLTCEGFMSEGEGRLSESAAPTSDLQDILVPA
ncbi:uncharacterized protein QC763_0078610 [Podospora pseudopauciseta]|uniref:Uncharacterized protein n=1 Tax=Podospora pseudopauciseta TaxID=2093780 RepID=A0ABR0HBF7_9PEZI|nr:hypothetical protein QC763_0078610 [Podospora pseudopauciseta]